MNTRDNINSIIMFSIILKFLHFSFQKKLKNPKFNNSIFGDIMKRNRKISKQIINGLLFE